MENVNKQRRHFISLSELGYGPLEFNLSRVCLHLQSKWVGIIAIKIERIQIQFLSDVLVAVASLDLKVSTIVKSFVHTNMDIFEIAFIYIFHLNRPSVWYYVHAPNQ